MHLWNYRTTIKKTVDILVAILTCYNKGKHPSTSWKYICSAQLSAAVPKTLFFAPLKLVTFQAWCACSGNVFLSTLHFWLFANFSPQIKHTGKPASLANESVHTKSLYFRPRLLGLIHGYLTEVGGRKLDISRLQGKASGRRRNRMWRIF